jgi:CO dehydrogenase/acetyl-CoA synthase delta subunit
MIIKSHFWHILQKEIAYRKRVAKEHQQNMFTIHKVKKDIVVIKVQPIKEIYGQQSN